MGSKLGSTRINGKRWLERSERLAATNKELEARDVEIRVLREHHGDERRISRDTEEIGHSRSSLVAAKAPEDLKMSLGSEDSEGLRQVLEEVRHASEEQKGMCTIGREFLY